MTTAEMLRAQGRAQGRAEGEALGRATGEVLGQAKTLLKQLTIKFGPQPPAVTDAVHAATPAQLETWTARILTATTVHDVLG